MCSVCRLLKRRYVRDISVIRFCFVFEEKCLDDEGRDTDTNCVVVDLDSEPEVAARDRH